jgi:DNA-binding transcriptional LysR family regulator
VVSLSGLRAIAALAEQGSITAAAAYLGYSTSAVSQQIARLERDVQQPLVDRRGRRVTLTPAGMAVSASAERIVLELERMTAEVQAQADTVTGTLRIAAFPTAARGLVPAAVAALGSDWPALEVSLIEADSHRAVDLAARGTVDIAVAHDWPETPLEPSPDMRRQSLGEDVSDLLVAADHPLARLDTVRLTTLADETWLYEPGSVAHDLLQHVFGELGAPGRIAHIVREYATQIEMVGVGAGIALVPRMGRGLLPATVRAVQVDPPPTRRIYAVWRRSISRRPAVRVAAQALAAAAGAPPVK